MTKHIHTHKVSNSNQSLTYTLFITLIIWFILSDYHHLQVFLELPFQKVLIDIKNYILDARSLYLFY